MARPLSDTRVTAVLGPTNTGKTWRSIQAMLEHPSGMIGLPLRLLAREVYDKVVAARGEASVALVTGEEKKIPLDPRYFVCTVEAMPITKAVSFLAVDEVPKVDGVGRVEVVANHFVGIDWKAGDFFIDGRDTTGVERVDVARTCLAAAGSGAETCLHPASGR